MTLNTVIQRLKEIVLAHQQVRAFYFGRDFSVDKAQSYPAVWLQSNGGTVSLSGRETVFNFRMMFLDRAQHSKDADRNEVDVQSDMIRIAQDILAQLNHGGYTDWRISQSLNMELVVESGTDYTAGCYVDVNIAIMYKQNVCAIPTNLNSYGSEEEVELTIASGQSFIIRAGNTGNRFRVTMTEQVDTEEGIFVTTKID